MVAGRALAALLLGAPLAAQAGDRAGEEQPPLPADLVVPAAPALSAAEELATFEVAPGYRVELVCSEPLVVDPVTIAFDEYGRLWVCEMRGFMPDVDGTDEDAPVGVIAVLSDTDGDGRMDEREVFLDELVLPRAILPYRDGLLAVLPPELVFCRDTDGDGRADTREVVASGLGGITSPEHAPCSLTLGLDNWVHLARYGRRFRYDPDEGWRSAPDSFMGQWGLTLDDEGRFFYDTNSDPLRGDLYPARYALRNPDLGRAAGIDVRIAADLSTWPSRVTPGVNRGYQPNTLRDDFTLRAFTAACGPEVYRGTLAPELTGDAFVCEPAGNLVKRFRLAPAGPGSIGLVAENVAPGREFLTSTDERFRPVDLANGPDGALYVVDLYRGILQHRVFVTSFLRRQIEERHLATPVGLGRIWRVVPTARAAEPAPLLDVAAATWTELVDALSHPDGFWRDTAQRVLVAEGVGSLDAVELLREAAAQAPAALGRQHALWTLEGIAQLEPDLLRRALSDPDPRVVRAALQLVEPWLGALGHEELVGLVLRAARAGDARTRHQALLSLGQPGTARADEALFALATANVASRETRTALVSGLHERELAFLERIAQRWGEPAAGRPELVALLARTLGRSRREHDLQGLLSLAAELAPWARPAALQGLLDARPKGPRGEPSYLRLQREPAPMTALTHDADEATRALAAEVDAALAWPGRPGLPPEAEVRPLTSAEQASYARGAEVYAAVCTACHLKGGTGTGGTAPPLRESTWVLGDEERLARILLFGLRGPIERDGELWDLEMPSLVATDRELADVLTYIRREWGHGADPVTEDTVKRVRAASAGRVLPWSPAELEQRSEAAD